MLQSNWNCVHAGLCRLSLCACLTVAGVAQALAGPVDMVGAVDSAGGYGWQVLEKVLPQWNPPAGGSGYVVVAVRVGSKGEILYCDTRKSSGSRTVDMAACTAVAQAGSFVAPSFGVPVEVFLSLPAGGQGAAQTNAAAPTASPVSPTSVGAYPQSAQQGQPMAAQPYASVPQGQPVQPETADRAETDTADRLPITLEPGANYADAALIKIKPYLRVPRSFQGEGTVAVRLSVSAQGKVTQLSLDTSSGTPAVDQAVLKAIKDAGTLPASDRARDIILSFTLRGL